MVPTFCYTFPTVAGAILFRTIIADAPYIDVRLRRFSGC